MSAAAAPMPRLAPVTITIFARSTIAGKLVGYLDDELALFPIGQSRDDLTRRTHERSQSRKVLVDGRAGLGAHRDPEPATARVAQRIAETLVEPPGKALCA